MRKPKTAPSPWRVKFDANGITGRHEIRDFEDNDVAVVKLTTPAQARANAKLLAAAPEMLEILQKFFKAYELYPGRLGNGQALQTFIATRNFLIKFEGK